MRKALLLASIAVALAIANDRLTDKDRNVALDHLKMTQQMFLASVAGLTPEQLHFKPSPDRWSIYECAEHITVSEDLMLEALQKIVNSPPSAALKPKATDARVLGYGTDRSHKTKTEKAYEPTGRWNDLDEILAHFTASREKTLEFARTMPADLRDHLTENKTMDGYQWLLILSAHTQRHVLQINEVKNDPRFPKDR